MKVGPSAAGPIPMPRRLSASWSEVDEETGKIISDNQRFDRVITDAAAREHAQALLDYAAEAH